MLLKFSKMSRLVGFFRCCDLLPRHELIRPPWKPVLKSFLLCWFRMSVIDVSVKKRPSSGILNGGFSGAIRRCVWDDCIARLVKPQVKNSPGWQKFYKRISYDFCCFVSNVR
jgi:hypothetical protein